MKASAVDTSPNRGMNRLSKTDSPRGKGAPRTHTPSVRGAGTCAPVAGAAAARAQARGTTVSQDAGVPRTGTSPVPSERLYPPGFSIFLQSNPSANHPNGDEKFHLVGAGMSQSSVSPTDLDATRTLSPAQETDDIVNDLDAEEDEIVNVHEDSRTDRRLNWSVPEDIRLASAWLHHSKDPIDGNEKKGDTYWADVTKEYNKTTETSRKRNRNQLKIRWHRSKKPLTDFHRCWINASRVWQSGMSDDQLTDKALEMWAGQNKGKAFHLLHMWKVVRDDQKWSTARLKEDEKKEREMEKSAKASPAALVNFELDGERTPSPAQETDDIVNYLDAEEDEIVNVDEYSEDEIVNVDEDSRTDRRLNWSVPEDIRLASAWLHNLKDPIDGNEKKGDAYWADVTKEYNKTTETSRKRNRNQLKIRWHRYKKPLTDFHRCWINASSVWQSGISDDQLTDKALEMWAGQNKGKAFPLLHVWKVVRGDQKWLAYLARLKEEEKKENEKEKSAKTSSTALVNLVIDGQKRPMGRKKAKKELNGKMKSCDAMADFSGKFEKFIEASAKDREDKEKMTEIQQSLADKKIEIARLNHEAAHEQTKCKMLETYTQLLLAPTDQLNEDTLAERKLALESLRLSLFPK